MDNDKVFKLLDAGFTADEIRTMLKEEPEGKTHEEGAGDKPGATDTGHASEIEKPTDNALSELTKTVSELKETVKLMQESNINTAKTDKPGINDKIQEAIKSFTDTL